MRDPLFSLSESESLNFPQEKDREVPVLKDLLQDELVADFFRFVAESDLRLEALEALEKRLGDS